MYIEELKQQIVGKMNFLPTTEQAQALDVFAHFMADSEAHTVMILRGSAGTGKTTLSAAIVRTLLACGQKVVLLAPTGRAAKVFAQNSGIPAYTIHRRIYREKKFVGVDGQFNLNDNLHTDTLFVVDEASMISNLGMGGSSFGSGCLLDDLVRYVYQGHNDHLMFIGDTAQLPPVGEDESPALSADRLSNYGLKVYESNLMQVLRQSQESGILYNATNIRQMIVRDEATQLPKVRFEGFSDIQSVPGSELIECLGDSYHHVGVDDTIVITRSNKRANVFNQGIRNMILDREEELSQGDILMIVKNNYYWMEKERKALKVKSEEGRAFESKEGRGKSEEFNSIANHKSQSSNFKSQSNYLPSFLANGDRATVLKVRRRIDLYGFRFATLLLQFPDYGNYEMEAMVLLDTINSEAPALTHEQQEQLFCKLEEDYQDIPLKADRLKAIRNDPYFNALQVKFAYAVTCHKAQGGQWAHVYVDQGYMTDDMLSPDYIHWLYTAFTRATEKLYLVNWPSVQTDNAEEDKKKADNV